jgi:hypothetical protein
VIELLLVCLLPALGHTLQVPQPWEIVRVEAGGGMFPCPPPGPCGEIPTRVTVHRMAKLGEPMNPPPWCQVAEWRANDPQPALKLSPHLR